MKTLILLAILTFVLAEPNKSLEKIKDKRAPVGQSALSGGGGGGASYSGGSYSAAAAPSSQYGTPSAQYATPSSQYGTPSGSYGTPSATYLPQLTGHNYGSAGSASYGTAGLNYGVPNLSYLPAHMYSLPTINLPLTSAPAYAHSPAASSADLSGLFQQSYFLQPTVHSLFTPQLDFANLYPGLTHGYTQQFAALPAAVQGTTTKLGPVTFGAGHGGLADLGVYAAQQLAQTYQTPGQLAYSSPASSYSPSYSSSGSSTASSASYSGGTQSYSLPSSYSSPTSSYSSPSSYSSGSSSSYSPSTSPYSSYTPSSSYSSPSSSYSSPSSSSAAAYSSPSSSYSSPASTYGSQSSSGYNTINYSKH